VERGLSAVPWIAVVGTTHPLGFAGLTLSLGLAPSLGVRAAAVVTGVSAQGLSASDAIVRRALDDETIAAQFRAVDELDPAAFHVGALVEAGAVRAVARALAGRAVPIVVDPVIAASDGRRLADDATVAALCAELFAGSIVTPNLDEAEVLLGVPVRDEAAMRAAGRALRERFGVRAALVKGGHLGGDPGTLVDVLVSDRGVRAFTGLRMPGSMRGTGDALGTALAAHLAHGAPLEVAVERARAAVAGWIAGARRIGTMDVAPLGEV
jgi:hydroxymethylpyrimidine/phosphomethylpyrimidine kinase